MKTVFTVAGFGIASVGMAYGVSKLIPSDAVGEKAERSDARADVQVAVRGHVAPKRGDVIQAIEESQGSSLGRLGSQMAVRSLTQGNRVDVLNPGPVVAGQTLGVPEVPQGSWSADNGMGGGVLASPQIQVKAGVVLTGGSGGSGSGGGGGAAGVGIGASGGGAGGGGGAAAAGGVAVSGEAVADGDSGLEPLLAQDDFAEASGGPGLPSDALLDDAVDLEFEQSGDGEDAVGLGEQESPSDLEDSGAEENGHPQEEAAPGGEVANVEPGRVVLGGFSNVEHEELKLFQQKIIGWNNVGHSSPDAASRRIRVSDFRDGWASYIQLRFKKQLDWGVRRVLIHNPFGAIAGEDMQFDQMLEAEGAGLDWLFDDFVDEWAAVGRGELTGGEPVEVIAYIGSPHLDPEMESLLASNQMDAWWERAEVILKPIRDAGMSVAVDASARLPENHPGYEMMCRLQDDGVKVYVEAHPRVEGGHLFRFPCLYLDRYKKYMDENRTRFPSKALYAEERIRLLNGHAEDPEDPDWLVKLAVDTLAEGESLMADVQQFEEKGLTMLKLMRRVSNQSFAVFD